MKLLSLALFLLGTSAMAAPTPITESVDFGNAKFAELVTKALKKNILGKKELRAGGWSMEYKVGKGLTCSEHHGYIRPGGPEKVTYSCSIHPAGGWRFMGMESYGTGSNEKFSKALYDALDLPAEKLEDFATIKKIEFDEQTGRGTDRNQLSCIRPTESGEANFNHSCQLINNL
ncbi:MAG: hypothetical protein HUU37_04935 [Bdellovibrionales bacterium]|nr:hypothetical protein [Bdellovibrionales bacterium]